MAQPYDPPNFAPDLAQAAREAAARNTQRRQAPPRPRAVPYSHQSWGNLFETVASQYPPVLTRNENEAFPDYQHRLLQQAKDPNYIQQLMGIMPLAQGGMLSRAGPRSAAMAEQAVSKGASPVKIWRQNQVWQSPEGNWMQETPDWGTGFQKHLNILGQKGEMPLDQAYNHPELFKLIPELRRTTFQYDPGQQGSFFSPVNNRITLGYNPGFSPRDVTLHEISHAVSNLQQLPSGSSFPRELSRLFLKQGNVSQIYQNLLKKYPNAMDLDIRDAAAHTAYLNNPGERAARLTEYRSGMNPWALKGEHPGLSLERMLSEEGDNSLIAALKSRWGY